jgi:hypothetical protein
MNGEKVEIEQLAEHAARMLWGTKDGDDAHDMGFAALQTKRRTIRVNPQAVMFVEDAGAAEVRAP